MFGVRLSDVASLAYLVYVNQDDLVGRAQVDSMTIVVDEARNRIDHDVSF
jgi:hypothetical protein